MLKGLERIVLWYFEDKTRDKKIWSQNVYAYRQHRSTETAPHHAIYQMEKEYNNKNHVLAAFLDVNGAFHNTNITALVESITKTIINEGITKWVESMLINRTAVASAGTQQAEKIITRETPQGRVLSPVLFNLIMNNLIKEFEEKYPHIKIFNYADDLMIVAYGRNMPTIKQQVEEAF